MLFVNCELQRNLDMTKKHFEIIAQALHEAISANATETDMIIWAACCVKIAKAMACLNPRFDKARFLEACRNGR